MPANRDYYKEKLDMDIIFVGSSTVYSGISPLSIWKEQGYTSYARSNASQPMWTSYYMIEDTLKGRNKPKLIVLDVGFIKYDDAFSEEPSNRKAIDGMRPSLTKLRCIEAAMGETEKLIDYIFPVLRFHTRWKELTLNDLIYIFKDIKTTHNGHLIDLDTSSSLPFREEGKPYMEKEDTKLSEKNLLYLDKIIALCRKEGVELFLMKIPSYSDNWSYDYDDQIRSIANENGLDYINFDDRSDEIGLDYLSDSPDEGSHLNTIGAEKFSIYLADHIKASYEVPSHAEDPEYVSVWEEKYAEYENAKAMLK